MIRQATQEDLSAIVEMSRHFYATTFYSTWAQFDPTTVYDLAENLADNHVMLVAQDGDKYVGMVGLFVAPFMFDRGVTAAYEVVWWVDPEYQGNGVGQKLLAAIEPACKARGAQAIQMVRLATSPPQAEALYEKLGYKFSEASHTKTLEIP